MSNRKFTIIVPGNPIAKKRPRFFRRGNYVGTYNSQETEEGRFLFHVHQQWKNLPPIEGPIHLRAVFIMPIPKSTSQKKKAAMLNGAIYHTKKPDLDNCIKFLKDCLNGVIWKDDAQIVSLSARKEYGLNPKTVFVIERK